MKWRTGIRTALAFAIIGDLGWLTFAVCYGLTQTIHNAYAVWWVAGMVCIYMDTHDGRWPKGWEDLRAPYESATLRSGAPWTFEELRNWVEVDWNADPAALRASEPLGDNPPFRVIWLRDGATSHWEGREPNRIIWEYLHQRKR
jgi:hypothetical protein